jgi:hypothetical protein
MRSVNAQNEFSVCCTDIRLKQQSCVGIQMQLAYLYHCACISHRSRNSTLAELALCDPSTPRMFSPSNEFNVRIMNVGGGGVATCRLRAAWSSAALFKFHFPREEFNFIATPINIPAKSMIDLKFAFRNNMTNLPFSKI